MQFISTTDAPEAIGPYSQAVEVNGLVYTSGQIGLLPDGTLAGEDIETQMHQVMQNLYYVLEAAGAQLTDVIKTNIYLKDMNDFEAINEIYTYHFKEHKPARSTVAVRSLPKDVKIEIDCIAITKAIQ